LDNQQLWKNTAQLKKKLPIAVKRLVEKTGWCWMHGRAFTTQCRCQESHWKM